MWRRFEPHIDTAAADCAAKVISDEPFVVVGRPGGGGTLAIEVRLSISGLTAFAKPARMGPDNGRSAAHEKIASDLGYALGLPVAPVVLSRQTPGTTLSAIPLVALSYSALRQPRPFGGLIKSISPHSAAALREVATAMFVFHCWIDDHDHFGDSNALAEQATDGTLRSIFFDYSFALMREWSPPAPAKDRPQWGNPPDPYRPPGSANC